MEAVAAEAAASPLAAVPATARAAQAFSDSIGWELLLAFRHFESHVWCEVPQLARNGLRAAVIADVHRAAVHVLSTTQGGPFRLAQSNGVLVPPP